VLGVRGELGPSSQITRNFGERTPPVSVGLGSAARGKVEFFYASQADEKAAETDLPKTVGTSKKTHRSAFLS